jgi:predicted lysophospholipase L1 biosynthesis ABC-type transport system permease subunit
VRELDGGLPVYEMTTVEGQLDETILTDRLIAMLSAGFGAARDAARVYRSVRRDGIRGRAARKRTGYSPGAWRATAHGCWLVMREVLLLLVIGLAVGIPLAMTLGRYVASQLYGIKATDPVIAVWTVVLLTLVSVAAGLIPATRASRIDPILALRTE